MTQQNLNAEQIDIIRDWGWGRWGSPVAQKWRSNCEHLLASGWLELIDAHQYAIMEDENERHILLLELDDRPEEYEAAARLRARCYRVWGTGRFYWRHLSSKTYIGLSDKGVKLYFALRKDELANPERHHKEKVSSGRADNDFQTHYSDGDIYWSS
ncbi:hypothetical protein HY486_04130 [Candidatus Woesearchaeota archaeon]|nr:hypothetical protein [Candidatus Woesearchaeota archaeon]